MRYLLSTLIPQPEKRWSVIKQHILPFLLIVASILGLYWLSANVPAGPWTTFPASSVVLALIGMTALAWLNDIPHDEVSTKSQVRRGGLILTGAACLGLVFSPLVTHDWASWREVFFRLGSLIVWATMDGMPPWHKLISGEYKLETKVTTDA